MDQPITINPYKWLYIFVGIAVLMNFSGLFVTIIGPDGTLYATIAKTMVLRHDYVNLFAQGKDWLDKPHFPFWLTALSFNCFGFTTWAYKLPGILFLLLAARYTYLFARSLYNEEIALWAVLILLTSQHIILSNNDVRAEPYLTGLIIAAVYHFYKAHIQNNYWQLLAGCVFTAGAIMTKGMFALVPIGGAIAGHLIITRQWKHFFSWKWLLAGVLVLIFILPEIYCLYEQFDVHPEKLVFERHNVSGIKFFFWDSQFGRFFNTGPIKGSGDPFFFVHTTLWAFLPWSVLLFAALFQFIKKNRLNVMNHEWYSICGSLLTFLLFSASKFQLPHYLNIVFPFFAIITAQYLYFLSKKSVRIIRTIQITIIAVLLAIINLLHYYYQPDGLFIGIVLFISSMILLLVVAPQKIYIKEYFRVGFLTVLASFIINLYLNLVFYPSLLHYQAGSEAAAWLNKNNTAKLPVVLSGDIPFAMEFYLNQPLININPDGSGRVPAKPFILYAPASVIKGLYVKGWNLQPEKSFKRYWISRLKPSFLNKGTREKELTIMQLVVVRDFKK